MSATSKDGLFAECGALMGLSAIAVSLRFYGRTSQRQSLGLSDWTALFGVVCVLDHISCTMFDCDPLLVHIRTRSDLMHAYHCVVGVLKAYSDYDSASLSPDTVATRAKPEVQMALAYDWLNMTTLACAKLSALFLYHRIFNVPKYSIFNNIIKVTVAVIVAWYITFNVLSLLQCRSHFSSFWDGTFTEYCDLNLVWAQGLAISDFILDIWVLILPMPLILHLHTSLARKLSIIGVFLLAFVGLGASVARIVVFYIDTTPGGETLFIGVLEAGMTITVVNLPSIWHLCSKTIPQQVVLSLQSLRKLSSTNSLENRKTRDEEIGSVEMVKPKAAYQSLDGRSSSTVTGPLNGPDFRKDLQDRNFEALATGGLQSQQEQTNLDSPQSICVQHDVEISRETS